MTATELCCLCPPRKTDHARLGEILIVVPAQPDQFAMRAGIECDFLVSCESFIDENSHPIKIAKGRHGARFASRKPVSEFLLGGKFHDLCTRLSLQSA